ncbi:HAD family phosphatase [Vagococcus sp. BWB3-3]|uniref:HAD family phosphatase n=1 Tax=Vagococcus allomyrinae TaxID=2794353 RepID=A0A940SYF8_9ENTE|nr:HAD family phosphatase [Vagococcus allomyrinae]
MTKKYFFFDIDGTLTDRKTNQVVPSAQLALQKLQEAGHFVAIATGRAHYKARPFMEQIGLENMVCAGGGALVIDNQLKQNHPLDLEKAVGIIQQAEKLGYGVLLSLDDSYVVHAKNDLFRQQVGERQEKTDYLINPKLDFQQLTRIFKIYISVGKEEEERLIKRNDLGNLRFVPDYLMFQYDAKHQGILEMMKELEAPLAEVVVFGDDTNDLVMFDSQWLSIAMGNGGQDVKEKADYVTDLNVNDGIYKACQHFGWFNS